MTGTLADPGWSQAEDALHVLFKFDAFQPGQEDVLRAVFAGEDVLAVMPTGSGKSLCYQLPAMIRPGLTLVVSPLIALMRDQVLQLARRGIEAEALHSLNSAQENAWIMSRVRTGKVKLLYVAPERIALPQVQDTLRAAGTRFVAVDEAHCISSWGHDFRPDYLDLNSAMRALGSPQVLALTASADGPTRADIVRQLFERRPQVIVRSFDRPNLRLNFALKRRALQQVTRFVGKHRGETGLVYAATRRRTEMIASLLRARGHHALAYHAGLDEAARSAAQDAFLNRDGSVIVGTIAFGLGIDRPDVRFVCHADMPGSVEAYYQEIGRAGRDGKPADTLTLHGPEDALLRLSQIARHDRDPDHQSVETARFNTFQALCTSDACRNVAMLAALGEAAEPCGQCDNCRMGWPRRALGALARALPVSLTRFWTGGGYGLPDPEPTEAPWLLPQAAIPVPAPVKLSVAQLERLNGLRTARRARAQTLRVAPSALWPEDVLLQLAQAAQLDTPTVSALTACLPRAESEALAAALASLRHKDHG